MSKVRLYHLARNWDVPSADIIETLAAKGRRLKSHFVEVDSAEVPEIRAILQEAGFFGRPAGAEAQAPAEAAPAPAVAAVAEAPPPPPPAPAKAEPAKAASSRLPAQKADKAEKAEPAAEAAPAGKKKSATSGRQKAA